MSLRRSSSCVLPTYVVRPSRLRYVLSVANIGCNVCQIPTLPSGIVKIFVFSPVDCETITNTLNVFSKHYRRHTKFTFEIIQNTAEGRIIVLLQGHDLNSDEWNTHTKENIKNVLNLKNYTVELLPAEGKLHWNNTIGGNNWFLRLRVDHVNRRVCRRCWICQRCRNCSHCSHCSHCSRVHIRKFFQLSKDPKHRVTARPYMEGR